MSRNVGRWLIRSLALPLAFGAVYSCGSSSEVGQGKGEGNRAAGSSCTADAECTSGLCVGGACASGQPGGASCTASSDCVSGVCQGGKCVGNGLGAPSGSSCTIGDQCASGNCTNGACASGSGLPDGKSCASATECASGACTNGICGTGTSSGGGPDASAGAGGSGASGGAGSGAIGSPCTTGSDCSTGVCTSGKCAATGSGSGTLNGTVTTGPQWGGSGNGFRPLTVGCGPDTATQCTGTCEQSGGDPSVKVIRPPATLCFSSPDDLTPNDPAAVIEQSIETLNGVTYVHIRITFDPSFVDNVYGTDSKRTDSGWPTHRPPYPHTFNPDLVKSDHTEMLLTDTTGATVINFHMDYISADPTQPCGYGTLGVTGGDGLVNQGDPSKILAVSTSISRDLNGCGYCKNPACAPSGDCTIDSPTTDKSYTPNAQTPNWDYRVVYEAWIDASAFGSAGFGQAYMTYVHASPNKSTLTSLSITPSPCPSSWNLPYCPPSVIAEGGNCFGSPTGSGSGGSASSAGGTGSGAGGTGSSAGGTGSGAGGTGSGAGGTGSGAGGTASGAGGTTSGAGGTSGSGGTGGSGSGTCPVNYQIYITSEGQSLCTPIPFANYPGMTPCPSGYTLDLLSEGQYCIPI